MQSIRESVGGTLSRVAGGVATVSLLAGRPEMAAVAGAIGSISAPAQGSQSRDIQSRSIQRGNVFSGNGTSETVVQAARATPPPTAAAPQASSYQTSPAQGIVPQAALQSISTRQGFDAVQIKQIEEAAKHTASTQEAVANLQRAPGFERVDNRELQKAVEAARIAR